jgi:hypothetical protein
MDLDGVFFALNSDVRQFIRLDPVSDPSKRRI